MSMMSCPSCMFPDVNACTNAVMITHRPGVRPLHVQRASQDAAESFEAHAPHGKGGSVSPSTLDPLLALTKEPTHDVLAVGGVAA